MTTSAGAIEVVLGPMFSGKTTELMRRLRRHHAARSRVVLIKYARDTRYDPADDDGAAAPPTLASHDGQRLEALPAVLLLALAHVEAVADAQVVGVDEAQFFPDLVAFVLLCSGRGQRVVLCGLDGTFDRQQFGHAHELIPHADSVVKLTAVCMVCLRAEAPFTLRIDQRNLDREVIGGSESYKAACRECWDAAQTNRLPNPD